MFAVIRHKHDTAARVLAFSLAHPSPHRGHTAAVIYLQELLTQAESFAHQELTGTLTFASAVSNKADRRITIRADLAVVRSLAARAVREAPDLQAVFDLPSLKVNGLQFLIDARVILAQAVPYATLFEKYGLPDGCFDQLAGELEAFEADMMRKSAGIRDHVGASAGLQGVTDEMALVINQLDALNRYYFRDDVDLTAVWRSVMHVVWPRRDKRRHSSSDPTAVLDQSA